MNKWTQGYQAKISTLNLLMSILNYTMEYLENTRCFWSINLIASVSFVYYLSLLTHICIVSSIILASRPTSLMEWIWLKISWLIALICCMAGYWPTVKGNYMEDDQCPESGWCGCQISCEPYALPDMTVLSKLAAIHSASGPDVSGITL